MGSCSQYTDIAGSYDGELSRIYPTQYREIYFVIALMEETLKTNLSHIKTIGNKLNEIEVKMPQLKQHLTELETDYRRVSAYFDDILAEHEKTFMSVRRNIEQSEERKLAEMEMRMTRPVAKYQMQSSPVSYTSRLSSFERSELNPELPVYVS